MAARMKADPRTIKNWDALPPRARKGYGGVQRALRAAWNAKAEGRTATQAARRDRDLNEEARTRRIADAASKGVQGVTAAFAEVRTHVEALVHELEEEIRAHAVARDPLAPLVVTDGDSRSDRLAVMGINATRDLTRIQLRQEAQRALERALAEDTGDGAELLKLHARVARTGDTLQIEALEREVEGRLTEGSPQHGVWTAVVKPAQEERLEVLLPEELRVERAHAEAILGVLPLLQTIEAEAALPSFYDTKPSPALRLAVEVLGQDLGGSSKVE